MPKTIPLSGRDGRPDRPLKTAATWGPKFIKLEGANLVFDADRSQTRPSGTGLLREFLRLSNASDDDIAYFSRKWGGLHLEPVKRPGLTFVEPTQVWRDLAVRLDSILRVSAAVNAGNTGDADDWEKLHQNPEDAKKSLKEARFCLMSQVRRLVEQAGVRPRLYWNDGVGGWQIDLDSDGRSNLLAVLTIQLMFTAAGKDSFAICSGCRKSYPPARMPSPGRRNYCDECREKGVQFRDAMRERRRRAREMALKNKGAK